MVCPMCNGRGLLPCDYEGYENNWVQCFVCDGAGWLGRFDV